MKAGLPLLLILLISASTATGQVTFVPDRIDFGELLQMDRREFDLEILNGGPDLLPAAGLKLDCGCLRLLSSAVDLAPGKSGRLRFELSTEQLRGAQRKVIRWGGGRISLGFSVLPDFVIEPASLQLGELARGGFVERSVVVRARAGLEAELVLLQAPSGTTLRIEALDRERGAAAAWRLHLRQEAGVEARAGAFEQVVLIEPRGARVPLIQIGVFGRVIGLVEARPGVLDFGRVPRGEAGRARLRLESRDGRPFRVLGYRLLGRRVALEEGATPAPTAEIEIDVELGEALGARRGIVDLILDHPGEKKISVAWRARVIERKP